jgi:AraC-like DNA-binding protein
MIDGRSHHALVYRKKGSARFVLQNGKEVFSSPQNIFFISSGMGYKVEYTDGETIAIHFQSENCEWGAENYDFTKDVKFYNFFQGILQKWQDGECIYEINAMFYQLLSHLRKEERREIEYDAFYKAVEYLTDNFADAELSIEKVGQTCGISSSNLRLKFSKYYGYSPIEYLTRLRVEFAVRLLSIKEISIEEVAEKSGFSDSKYFSRIIKKYYGVPPLKLRKTLLL